MKKEEKKNRKKNNNIISDLKIKRTKKKTTINSSFQIPFSSRRISLMKKNKQLKIL